MTTTRIQLRRDTAANWTSANPVLLLGEPGIEVDTGNLKYGDGTSAWNVLGYFRSPAIIEQTIPAMATTNLTAFAVNTALFLSMRWEFEVAMVGATFRASNYYAAYIDDDGDPQGAASNGSAVVTSGFILGQMEEPVLVGALLVPRFTSYCSVAVVVRGQVSVYPRPVPLPESDCPTPVDFTCETDCAALAADCGRGDCYNWQGGNCP